MNRFIKWLTYQEENNPYLIDTFNKVLIGIAAGCVFGILILTFLINNNK